MIARHARAHIDGAGRGLGVPNLTIGVSTDDIHHGLQ
jgi:hypothetical protein